MAKRKSSAAKVDWTIIQQSVMDLAADPRFQRYLDGLYGLKDVAVGEACRYETLNSPTVTAGAIGRIQAFQDMIDFIEANTPKFEVESESQQ